MTRCTAVTAITGETGTTTWFGIHSLAREIHDALLLRLVRMRCLVFFEPRPSNPAACLEDVPFALELDQDLMPRTLVHVAMEGQGLDVQEVADVLPQLLDRLLRASEDHDLPRSQRSVSGPYCP